MATRPVNRLTDKSIRSLTHPGYHADGGNLYLQVTASGDGVTRSWVIRYRSHGKVREMGAGSYPGISLKEAREKAIEARRMVREGIDPIEAKRTARQAVAVEQARRMTFDECADAYISAHEAGWKNAKHQAQWRNTLGAYVSPVFGSLPVADIDTALVMKALEPIWQSKPETATRVRGRIESVLSWATVRGYREGANPAQWRGHLDKLLPKRSKVAVVKHHPALPYDQMHAFMKALQEQQQDSIAAICLEFTILTAARTSEAINAAWLEFDLANAVWTIPAERMKAKREHRVPLSPRALALLRSISMHNTGPWVFAESPKRPIGNMAMLALLKRMGRTDLTVHGFRSTFRDWAAEKTSFPPQVAEMALAHTIGDKVEAAYRRGELFDKRRQLMTAWAKFVDTKPATSTGNVVSIREAKP